LLHVPYDIKKQAIAEIARVLKPGGKALLIENTWADPSPHVYSLSVAEWENTFNSYDMRLVHRSAHCFNLFRRSLPSFTPFRDFLSIYLDYPLEYALMRFFYLKESRAALQHLMVFEKK
jgi:SAM-dependent methyltransferase